MLFLLPLLLLKGLIIIIFLPLLDLMGSLMLFLLLLPKGLIIVIFIAAEEHHYQ